ncbi:MAG: Arylsulfatase [Paenibacillaceae bacterium]|nr:Arylsulfatase [Paenibacillaceae bacterium]
MENKRPHILFAIADDASHMSAYGHALVHTPHFDRVAAEGVLFSHAFTTNPKCAPSRASILTGRHTWELEEACNHFGVFSSQFKVFPDLLEQSGYHVGYTGKGWGPGDWQSGGFTRNPAGKEYNECVLVPPEQTHISPKDYAANFRQFLDEREGSQPFCFWYGGHEPHRSYAKGEGLRAGKRLEDVVVPVYLPDDDIVKSDLLDYAYEIEWFDTQLGQMLSHLEAIGELEDTLVIVTSDNGMPFPRVKGQMYEDDFKLPLAVRWGAGAPSARIVDDLVSFIDLAPTILDAAQCHIPEEMSGGSLLRIVQSRESGQIDPSRNRIFMGKERHDVGTEGDVGYPVRCIRTEQYLYVHNFKPELWPAGNPETGFTNVDGSPTKTLLIEQHESGETDYYYDLAFGKRPQEELFDIRQDPACMNNLADDPAFHELKLGLWAELRELLERTGDPRIFGKGDVFDTYAYVGHDTHSWKAYVEGYFEKQNY